MLKGLKTSRAGQKGIIVARRLLGTLYIQVLIGIVLGLLVGALWPETGAALKPLGDAFIKLIKMVIAPVIFCTVALGIAQMGDMKKFGRIGGKAILYFEVVSTLALVIGLVVGHFVRPGAGFNIDPATLDPSVTAAYVSRAQADSVTEHLMHIIPDTFLGALTSGDLLQVLLVAILFGYACTKLGEAGRTVAGGLEKVIKVFFGIGGGLGWLTSAAAIDTVMVCSSACLGTTKDR